jgi:uncharacterized protein (DUF2236 family)
LPSAAGCHAAGSAYSAFDPQLMLWTLAVIADSGRAVHEALVGSLDAEEREDCAGETWERALGLVQ